MSAALVLALAAIAAGSNLGVRLQEAGELPYEDATRMTEELGRALEDACGRAVAIDDPVWSRCAGDVRCVEQIRERTHSDEVVLVRVFGSLTIARVVTERFVLEEKAPRRAEIDVPRDARAWRDRLEELARLVCPVRVETAKVDLNAQPSSTPDTVPLDAPPPRPLLSRALPWIVIGAGAIAAGAGIVFGASSASARSDSQSSAISDAEFEALADRTQAHAIAADVLFVAAGAGLAAGVVLLLGE